MIKCPNPSHLNTNKSRSNLLKGLACNPLEIQTVQSILAALSFSWTKSKFLWLKLRVGLQGRKSVCVWGGRLLLNEWPGSHICVSPAFFPLGLFACQLQWVNSWHGQTFWYGILLLWRYVCDRWPTLSGWDVLPLAVNDWSTPQDACFEFCKILELQGSGMGACPPPPLETY